MFRKSILTAVMMGVGLLGMSGSAEAAFRLRVESGTTTGPGVVITADGSSALDTSTDPDSFRATTTDQVIVFSGPITTQFTINTTTGTSTPTLAAPGFFEAIDLSNITINASGAGVLRLILEQTDFGANTPDGLVEFRSDVGGVLTAGVGSSITFDSYADDANGVPALGSDVFPAGALAAVTGIGAGSPATLTQSFGPGAFSGSAGTDFTQSGTYSVYTVVTVNFTGAGSVSFNQMVGTAPAPAGLVLILSGLPALGIGAWFRRRRAPSIV